MDRSSKDRSLRENRFPSRRDQDSPSFSSTLLDAIYRSIDEGRDDMLLYNEKSINRTGFEDDHEQMAKLRRACLIEKWMEKKVTHDKAVRRGSMPDFERKPRSINIDSRDPLWLSHSSSTSSDSSSGTGFSSSEAESGYKPPLTIKPKMILRNSVFTQPEKLNKKIKDQKDFSKTKDYANTKSKAAMKIFNDFKKSKQPLSPGGRLTSFLNSLFTATSGTKKTKISKSAAGDQREEMAKTKYAQKLTCSSASSFSRSCLSKTQSSREKMSSCNVAGKRSVKFCPVNVIVDEYYQPQGQKTVYDVDITIPSLESMKHRDSRNSMREELKLKILERNRRVEEGKKYQEIDVRNEQRNIADDDDDEVDDAASCASSDLFELDSLSAIGMDEELPVYETTRYLRTNRFIP